MVWYRLVCCFWVATACAFTLGQVNGVWDWRFSGTGNSTANFEGGNQTVVDASGNVYVCGSTGRRPDFDSPGINSSDWLVLKYSATGQLLWWRRSNGTANGLDVANSIAVDANGTVYVAGCTYGGNGGINARIQAYNPDGGELWNRIVDSGKDTFDEFRRIKIDSAGDVVAVGTTFVRSGGQRWLVEKLRRFDGNVLWSRTFGSAGTLAQSAVDVGFDSARNVYVYGSAATTSLRLQLVVGKWSATGSLQWSRFYAGLDTNHCQPVRLHVASNGIATITGAIVGPGLNSFDYATVQYSATGNRLWDRVFSGGNSHVDIPRDLAVDNSGNVYVCGGTSRAGFNVSDYVVLKYSSVLGTPVYERRFGGTAGLDDEARAISVDRFGFVTVGGLMFDLINNQRIPTLQVLYLDPFGNRLWNYRYVAAANSDFEVGLHVKDSEISVTGSTFLNASGIDITALRLRMQPSIANFNCVPNPLIEGSPAQARIVLNFPALVGGRRIEFQENSLIISGIPSVTIPAGSSTGASSFHVQTSGNPPPVDIRARTDNQAVLRRFGISTRLTGFVLGKPAVIGGQRVGARVEIARTAPSGGTVVSLSSSSSLVTIPSAVRIPSGNRSVAFPIEAKPVSVETNVTLRATMGSVTLTRVLKLVPPAFVGLQLTPTELRGGGQVAGTVLLNGKSSQPTVISLSDDSTRATTPPSVTIPAGADRATFRIQTAIVSTRTTINVTARLGTRVYRASFQTTP
jgi:hypothetical protein